MGRKSGFLGDFYKELLADTPATNPFPLYPSPSAFLLTSFDKSKYK